MLSALSGNISIIMDVAGLDKIVNVEADYDITLFFSSEIQHHLQPLIDYRIKLLLKNSVVIHCGETQEVETACILNQKLHKLSLTLKPYEHLPVVFEASGTISPKFRGRVKVSLTNYSFQNVKMCAGTPVGYIVLQPFSLK